MQPNYHASDLSRIASHALLRLFFVVVCFVVVLFCLKPTCIIISPKKAYRKKVLPEAVVCVRSLCSVRAEELRTERSEETEETLPVDGGLYLVSELTVLVRASIKTQGI